MATLKLRLGIGFVNGNHEDYVEIPDEDLEGMSEEEKESYFEEIWQEWIWNYIDGGWEVVD